MPAPIVPVAAPPLPTAASGAGTSRRAPPVTPDGPGPAKVGPGRASPAPETLHPALWRGHQLGRAAAQGVATGFPSLDEQLPGGGWPCRALSELLLPHLGIGEIRLMAPALAAVQQAGRLVMLFDPPAQLNGWALAEMGLAVEQLLLIQSACQVPVDAALGRRAPPEASAGAATRPVGVPARLWALEQALKSGHVGAVLAWLPPRLSPDRVRRLQLAAQAHDGPAFMLREASAQGQPSASPLRLGLRAAGVDQLAVSVLKRRGPPLLQPVHLRLPAWVPAAAARRASAEAADPAGLRASPALASAAALSDAAAGAFAGASLPGASPAHPLSAATFVNLA